MGWQLRGSTSWGSREFHSSHGLGRGNGLGVLGVGGRLNRFDVLDATRDEGLGYSYDGPRATSLVWRPKGRSGSRDLFVPGASNDPIAKVQSSFPLRESDV